MKVTIQRVLNAKVETLDYSDSINKGLLLLVSFTNGDTWEIIDKMVKKILNLRIFEDSEGKMNLNISQVDGEVMSISQFTLYANPYEGNRPSFTNCMYHKQAQAMYDIFNEKLMTGLKKRIATGKFGEDMKITTTLDGPVTIELEFKTFEGRI